jgi:c-di-GMP-binding flagellar brake protein YcgR
VDTPVVRFGERFTREIQGSVRCGFIESGQIYDFHTITQESTLEEMTFLKYPIDFTRFPLRRHPRLEVEIMASLALETSSEPATGVIVDLSQGGCQMKVPKALVAKAGMDCLLEFSLPDYQPIRELRGSVRKVKVSRVKHRTDLGVEFLGPPELLERVESFCNFCSFLRFR